MACFVVPAAEAAIVTIVNIVLEHRSQKAIAEGKALREATSPNAQPFYKKIKSLSRLLWGGSALLAFEHLWHGEIQPFYPFLTAATDPAAMSEVYHEMATVGTSMAAFVTLSWAMVHFVRSRMVSTAPATVKLQDK